MVYDAVSTINSQGSSHEFQALSTPYEVVVAGGGEHQTEKLIPSDLISLPAEAQAPMLLDLLGW